MVKKLREAVYLAFFSKEAAERFGCVVYLDQDGKKVACTAVCKLPRWRAELWFRTQYLWGDKRCVGIVADDCIGAIEGGTKTRYEYYDCGAGEMLQSMSLNVPGTPGTFTPYNGFVPTDDEKAELVRMAKETTGYSGALLCAMAEEDNRTYNPYANMYRNRRFGGRLSGMWRHAPKNRLEDTFPYDDDAVDAIARKFQRIVAAGGFEYNLFASKLGKELNGDGED